MNNFKTRSISYLNDVLRVTNNSRQFAESKLRYLTPNNPNAQKEIFEFESQRDRANFKISELAACITWLSNLELDEDKI